MVGAWQAPAPDIADDDGGEHPVEEPFEPDWKLLATVRGPTEEVLGDEVISAAGADEGSVRVRRRIGGDVGARVAEAHDEHSLAGELVRVDIGHGVTDLA